MFQTILQAYQLDPNRYSINPFGTGLINNTWKVSNDKDKSYYLLQRINTSVFKKPEDIANNIRLIADYLQKYHKDYLFVSPLKNKSGEDFVMDKEYGYFRLFPFLTNSHSLNVITAPMQAYEASRQFGLFTRLLSGFDLSTLKNTLNDFHNLTLRYKQFKEALEKGNKERINKCSTIISFLKSQHQIVDVFESIKTDYDFKLRVTHHDTKISNVLFGPDQKAICVIDLDTVMPGYFISDAGDMMRTYLSPVSEESKELDKIEVREEYFEAIVKGYLSEMNKELNEFEKDHFVYAGKFMIYMQALRFLTDYLNDDIYYSIKYEDQNLVRATNQICLLQKLIEKEEALNGIVKQVELEII
jgi:Putative homoserine kinase type II (protein kinase fold)